MPYLSRRAANGLLAFATGLAALSGSGARAQADPFALPKSAVAATAGEAEAAGPGLSEIEVDGRVMARLVDLRGTGDALTIDADNARVAGLPVSSELTGPVRVASIPIYRWHFDTLRQRLVVRLLRRSDGRNLRDLAMMDDADAASRTVPALRVDYDVSVAAGRGGVQAGGLFNTAFVKGGFAIGTSAQVTPGPGGGPVRVRRLDSYIQYRFSSDGGVATGGDFVSGGSASQRPVRMAGLQLASDAAYRPDIVTSPLPAFTGNVAVPTSLDILSADQNYALGELEPGEFTIRNIPTNPGRGALSVVLKDALGRETVRTISFYQSSTLLRPGLRSYAVNAGFVRRRYGDRDDGYGPFAASAFYRRGLSPFLTLETSGEVTPGLVNLGARADFTIGNVALATTELRSSRDELAGGGAMLNVALESLGRTLGGRVGASIPTARYRDVASHLGDAPPRRQFFANFSFDLRRNVPFQLSYVRQEPARNPRFAREGVRSELLTANLFFAPATRLNLFVTGGMRREERRSVFVSASVTLRLGARHMLSAAAGRGEGEETTALGYQFNDHANTGLRAHASLGTFNGNPRFGAAAIHESRHTMLNGGLVIVPGQVAGQFSATGTLIAAGGTVYARGQSANGYALVRAGDVAGIPIKLENRLIGVTDRRGRLLVHDLRNMVPQHIDVDGTRLPPDAVVMTSRHTVIVPPRAIGVVDIDAVVFRPVYVQLTDPAGLAVAAGQPVVALPSGRETLVGFDGLVEFNTASGDRALLVGKEEAACRADIPTDPAKIAAPLVCRPVPAVAAARAAPKVARRD